MIYIATPSILDRRCLQLPLRNAQEAIFLTSAAPDMAPQGCFLFSARRCLGDNGAFNRSVPVKNILGKPPTHECVPDLHVLKAILAQNACRRAPPTRQIEKK